MTVTKAKVKGNKISADNGNVLMTVRVEIAGNQRPAAVSQRGRQCEMTGPQAEIDSGSARGTGGTNETAMSGGWSPLKSANASELAGPPSGIAHLFGGPICRSE